jgi:hypothetical protein
MDFRQEEIREICCCTILEMAELRSRLFELSRELLIAA